MSCMSNAYYELICCGHTKRHQQTHTSNHPVISWWVDGQKQRVHHGKTRMKHTPKQMLSQPKKSSGEHTGHQAGVPQERLATPSCQGNAIPDTSSQMWVKEYVMCFAITWFQLWIVQSGHHSAVEATKRHQLVRLV